MRPIMGFTGTRHGMTEQQRVAFKATLLATRPESFHHGDCVGADAEAHSIVRAVLPDCTIVIHPSTMYDQRAWCEGDYAIITKPPLERNRDIVDASTILVATPKELEEIMRSGTWSTVRYARRGKVTTIILQPGIT